MKYFSTSLAVVISSIFVTNAKEQCNVTCPTEGQSLVCGFDQEGTVYKMFPSRCAMSAFAECYKVEYAQTPLEFCIKHHNKIVTRRYDDQESCPVFCPTHYRPVCGASKYKSYKYRSFNNGCYMDMLNCRGEDEELGYVEVPLEFCQKHAMKNIWEEHVMISGLKDYRDYD